MASRRSKEPDRLELVEVDETPKPERPRVDVATTTNVRRRKTLTLQNSIEAAPDTVSTGRNAVAKAADTPAGAKSTRDPNPADPSADVPAHISTRYVRAGKNFHFPNRDLAFVDHGDKLSTKLENTETIGHLVDIAKYRDFGPINIKGSKSFRQEAWLQASVAGLTVKNYRPSELDQEILRRRLGKDRSADSADTPGSAVNLDREQATLSRPRQPEQKAATEPVSAPIDAVASRDRSAISPNLWDERAPKVGETFSGQLVKHGLNSREPSLVLRSGDREVALTGEDLQRAVKQSLSQAKVGDHVSIQYWGAEREAATRPVRSGSGSIEKVPTHAAGPHRWSVETSDFVRERAQLASVVRNEEIPARDAVARHPSLLGIYRSLDGARAKIEEQYTNAEDRARFLQEARERLAQYIERNRPLPVLDLESREVKRGQRELVQERTL
jgi:hypothetical protein